MMDVTKQKDLSGFYRHFLNQQTGEEKIPNTTEDGTKIKKEEKQVYLNILYDVEEALPLICCDDRLICLITEHSITLN